MVFLSSVRLMASRLARCMNTSSSSTPCSTVVTVSNAVLITFTIITSRSFTDERNLRAAAPSRRWVIRVRVCADTLGHSSGLSSIRCGALVVFVVPRGVLHVEDRATRTPQLLDAFDERLLDVEQRLCDLRAANSAELRQLGLHAVLPAGELLLALAHLYESTFSLCFISLPPILIAISDGICGAGEKEHLEQVFAALDERVNLSEDAALVERPALRRELVVHLRHLHRKQKPLRREVNG